MKSEERVDQSPLGRTAQPRIVLQGDGIIWGKTNGSLYLESLRLSRASKSNRDGRACLDPFAANNRQADREKGRQTRGAVKEGKASVATKEQRRRLAQ